MPVCYGGRSKTQVAETHPLINGPLRPTGDVRVPRGPLCDALHERFLLELNGRNRAALVVNAVGCQALHKRRTQMRTGLGLALRGVASLPVKNWNVFPLVISENYGTRQDSLLVFVARKLGAKIKDQL